MKKKTIILSNATVRSGNKGCLALCYSLLYVVDRIFSERGIAYKLYLTDSKDGLGHHEIVISNKKISYESIENGFPTRWQDAYKLLTKFKKTCRLFKLFKNADCIMDIGQGDSFADIYGVKRFRKIDKIHRMARMLGKPYILLPQTIGPFEKPKIRKEAVKTLNKAHAVMVRDRISLDYANALTNHQANVKEYIDVAFFLPYSRMEFSQEFVHVGLNISGLLWNGGYTRNNQFGLKADYQNVIRQIINYFLSLDNVKLHLISHVSSGIRNIESDYVVEFDLWKEYHHERLVLAPFFHTPIEAKDYIAGLDFFMGTRMHATIAAFSAGVPVVPMAYSRKFNGLFVDTLSYQHIVDLKENEENAIMEKVAACFANRDGLQKEIDNQLGTTVAVQKEKIVSDLTSLLCS